MLPKPKPYEKIPQLARRLGVHRSTIWRWAQPDKKLVEITRLGRRLGVRARLLPDVDR